MSASASASASALAPAPAPVRQTPRQLVLLGGGHAHVKVLADLADAKQSPLAGWQLHLVTPYRRQIYSGMLPGWIAGHYPIEACAIALDRLAAAAGVQLHQTSVNGLDLAAGRVLCADGSALPFDQLSIDTGPMPALAGLPGSAEFGLSVRPIEAFIAAWPAVVQRIVAASGRFELLLLGAGAAGVELAFAIQHRARVEGWQALRLTLVGHEHLPLDGQPSRLRRRIAALLAQRGIRWLGNRQAERLSTGQLHLAQGAPLPFDGCLLATGAAAPAWPAASGLATDERGFIRVGTTLQSLSHPQVWAAGDVAALTPPRPKSGVYAVRAGPVLARNLRAACAGRPPEAWAPQARALYLISTGERHALASWGPWSWGGWGWSGAWVWRWKDHIDRQFMRRFGTAL